jgi:hypothetical protein
VKWKKSGNGKEMEWKERETNDISKWIWKWNGMEKEWKWNFGVILVESLHWNFAKFLSIPLGTIPFHSIPFHGIPLSILKCRPLLVPGWCFETRPASFLYKNSPRL